MCLLQSVKLEESSPLPEYRWRCMQCIWDADDWKLRYIVAMRQWDQLNWKVSGVTQRWGVLSSAVGSIVASSRWGWAVTKFRECHPQYLQQALKWRRNHLPNCQGNWLTLVCVRHIFLLSQLLLEGEWLYPLWLAAFCRCFHVPFPGARVALSI